MVVPDEQSFLEGIALGGLVDEAELLAEAVFDTIHDSLLVLDGDLRVVLANRSFYLTFQVQPSETLNHLLYDLGNGQWNIPALRHLLEAILPERTVVRDYQVDHDFPKVGPRIMRLNSRKLRRRPDQPELLLLAIMDVTVEQTALREHQQGMDALRVTVREKDTLLRELHHRVKNNLQVILSLLSLQTSHVGDPGTADVLQDAQNRIQAMALIHEMLYQSRNLAQVEFGEFARRLLRELAALYSLVSQRVQLRLDIDNIAMDVNQAIPLGLLLNELVVNCFKHAFPDGQHGTITVSLRRRAVDGQLQDGRPGELCVQDGGIGFPAELDFQHASSMGLSLVRMLTQQLRGRVQIEQQGGTYICVRFPLV